MGEPPAAPSLENVALPSLGAAALPLKAFFHPERMSGVHETYELHLGHEVLQVQVNDGELRVQQGQALKADAVFQMDMQIFMGLFAGQVQPDEAVTGGLVRIEGDTRALSRFLNSSSVPNLDEPSSQPKNRENS